MGPHRASRVDRRHALGGHSHLGAAHCGQGGDDLTVEVRRVHRVTVHQIESPHPAAGQGLHGIAAHTAHTEHGHAGRGQTRQALVAEQQAGAGKDIVHRLSHRQSFRAAKQAGESTHPKATGTFIKRVGLGAA